MTSSQRGAVTGATWLIGLGIVLLIAAALVGPGGYSIFSRRA